MYFGSEPNINLSAKMVLCDYELKRVREGKLRGSSYESVNGYVCIHTLKGKKKRIGVFETIEECNTAYDNFDIEKLITYQKNRLKSKGYNKSTLANSVKFVVKMEAGNYKTFETEKQARAEFEKIIANNIKALQAKIKPIKKTDK